MMRTERQSTLDPHDAAPVTHCFEIWPHRSLGRAGVAALLGAIAAGLAFVALRSPAPMFWPIAFGCVLTFASISLALASNMRSARVLEKVEIGPKVVRVHRTGPDGRGRTAEFATHWVRVVVSHDRDVACRITLIQSGQRVSVGAFLSPAEREGLADAIRTSLAEAKGDQTGRSEA